jgi:phytanoyl-CoA hydroxylase
MNNDDGTLRDTFRRDGFIHVEHFLDSGEAEEVEVNLARFIREIVPILPKTEAMFQDYGNPETLKQITRLEIDPFFAGLLASPKVRGLAETLLEEKVIPQSIQFFNKPPLTGTPTPPHQDGYYFCLVPNEALTVWIALDDINEENGALHYWKGSHEKGVLPHGASRVLGFSQGLNVASIEEVGGEAICGAKRGDCLIHHALMVHSASPNRSPRTRRALGLVYYAESAKLDPAAWRRYQDSVQVQQKGITQQ